MIVGVLRFFHTLGNCYWIRLKKLVELTCVIRRYYSNPTFRKADLSLYYRYLLKNPYTISRQYLQWQEASDVHLYGETPLTTLAKIAKECELLPNDYLYDLGCGTGRTSLWLRLFVGCQVRGIEQVPTFVQNANKVTAHINGLTISQEDMFLSDYKEATAIYLYGTCLTDSEIKKLTARLQVLPKKTRIITVSYPLEGFTLLKQFPAKFPWGEATVYLQEP